MRDLIVTSLINGAVGSLGATSFLFVFYWLKGG